MQVNPGLVIVPIAVGFIVVLVGGFIVSLFNSGKKALALENAARDRLRKEHIVLRDDNIVEAERWRVNQPQGHYSSFLAGTGGVGVGEQQVKETVRASADHLCLPQLVLEPERSSRHRYLDAVSTLPAWGHKVVAAEYPLMPSGGGGRTPTEMLAMSEFWVERDVRQKTGVWLDLTAQAGYPSMLEGIQSDGGTGICSAIPIEEFKRKYPQVPVYVSLLVDSDPDRRSRNTPDLLDRLYDLVDGICLLDNGRVSDLTDQALALHGPALKTAPWTNHRTRTAFNIWSDVHRHHKFSTIRISYRMVTVHHRPAFRDKLPAFYYTPTAPLETALLNSTDEVLDDPSTQSCPLEQDGPTYVHAIGPFEPDPSLIRVAESVEASVIRSRGSAWNSKLGFASIAKPLAGITEVGVIVVSFFPLAVDLQTVKQYLTGKLAIDPKFRPKPSILAGGNGHYPSPSLNQRLADLGLTLVGR